MEFIYIDEIIFYINRIYKYIIIIPQIMKYKIYRNNWI